MKAETQRLNNTPTQGHRATSVIAGFRRNCERCGKPSSPTELAAAVFATGRQLCPTCLLPDPS